MRSEKIISEGVGKIGRVAGKMLVGPGLALIKEMLTGPEKVRYIGLKNLLDMGSQPYLMAANHIKPSGKISQKSGLSPDAMFLSSFVETYTGRKLRILVKCDDGWRAEGSYRYFQKYFGQPFGHGLQIGADNIPVKKNPGSLNRDLISLAGKAKEQNRPILIFPEGSWHEDFDPAKKMESGVANLAKKLNLPILPVYIHGCDSWHSKHGVDLAFGKSWKTGELSSSAILDKLAGDIAGLQADIKTKLAATTR